MRSCADQAWPRDVTTSPPHKRSHKPLPSAEASTARLSKTWLAVGTIVVGALFAASGAAAVLPIPLARLGAAGIVLVLAALVTLEAVRLVRPLELKRRGSDGSGSRILWSTLILFALGLFASGALRVGDSSLSSGVRLTSAYGPLTVWPTLQASLPHLDIGLHLTLGHAIILGVSAFVMALTIQMLSKVPTGGGSRWRPLFGISPVALVPGACPFCLPIWASLGGAALAPLAAAAADPFSPLGAALTLVAPLVALGALHMARRGQECTLPTPPRPPVRRLAIASVSIAVLLALPAAAALAGMPRGDSARQDAIYGLMVLATIAAVILVLLVLVLMVVFAWRYRARDEDAAPRDDWALTGGRRKALIASFFIVPLVFIFGVGAVSFGVLMDHEDHPDGATEIGVVASQFAWRFTYPDGEVRLHELHVIEDQPVSLNLTSNDVVHSLFIPDLGVKMDAMPGTTTQTWFEARNTGTYAAYCVEWCGHGHPEMRASIVVHPPGTALPPAATPGS